MCGAPSARCAPSGRASAVRFQALQLLVGGRDDRSFLLLVRDNVVTQPRDKGIGVRHGRGAVPQRGPNLGAMVFDRATGPVILEPVRARDTDLRRDVRDDDAGNLVPVARKAPLLLKGEQQNREAEPRRTVLVGEEGEVTREQGPVRDQLLGRPLSFHTAPPFPSVTRTGSSRSAENRRCRHFRAIWRVYVRAMTDATKRE